MLAVAAALVQGGACFVQDSITKSPDDIEVYSARSASMHSIVRAQHTANHPLSRRAFDGSRMTHADRDIGSSAGMIMAVSIREART
ncbi:hypothetical protein PMN64_32305 [Bradyrhizobium sp. UFLA01-814]|uniref:hypothetical protein n=1 Tax=Bradyrhizobium sp. UFLA01-814 TaxID=3023480 RepID=UPI00398AE615